jgi:hypothetical protein
MAWRLQLSGKSDMRLADVTTYYMTGKGQKLAQNILKSYLLSIWTSSLDLLKDNIRDTGILWINKTDILYGYPE